ncbi:MAG: aminotransferase class I/II-fold pyridoxal phosphate-dependent enzyme [Acidimicrobiales bacterium]
MVTGERRDPRRIQRSGLEPSGLEAVGSCDTGEGPSGDGWAQRINSRLRDIRDAGRWRSPREFDAVGQVGVLSPPRRGQCVGSAECDEARGSRETVSFASNDYLGLSAHPRVKAAAHAAIERWGTGSGGSRLVTGSRPIHRELEEALASFKSCEAAICFPTGYAANLGVLGVLGTRDTRILSDELNHASIVDGCRISRAEVSVYRHLDVDHISDLLKECEKPSIVVTDTVFSMDGDIAPLGDIAEVCRKYAAILVVDEAHGVLGPQIDQELLRELPVVRVGTLSKALGAAGGFVAASHETVDLLINQARPYIFTTSLAPPVAAAAKAALEVLESREGETLCGRLRELVNRVRPGHPSPIIPIVLGSEERALNASASLLEKGIFVPAIRPPTVPVGTSRLRLTVSAAHSDEQIDRLNDALATL